MIKKRKHWENNKTLNQLSKTKTKEKIRRRRRGILGGEIRMLIINNNRQHHHHYNSNDNHNKDNDNNNDNNNNNNNKCAIFKELLDNLFYNFDYCILSNGFHGSR